MFESIGVDGEMADLLTLVNEQLGKRRVNIARAGTNKWVVIIRHYDDSDDEILKFELLADAFREAWDYYEKRR